MKGSKEKLSMEKYMDFVFSQQPSHLKKHILNQIITMHGFKKITKGSQSVLTDVARTLNLMDPSRSTLKEKISPCASITLNEITTDLNNLAWGECCVTSISVINNTNTDTDTDTNASQLSESFAGNCRDSSASTSSYFGSEIGEVATKKVTKRKRSST
ncbi:hypothetical protein Pint_02796 [Pistacia integerrima]|uniref:Uncharacterized protein n=1 Tax=Pistacia integerrima TaxID=434235 RepID=A0ACC0ZIC8_9ROSI|nr:hypothetical protein Pint_02796 [Pistacia integerrima]